MRTKESSPGFGLWAIVSEGNSDLIVTGLFTETELFGMHKAADVKFVDQVLSFLGAISDKCFGNDMTADVTKVFTHYDVLHFVGRCN